MLIFNGKKKAGEIVKKMQERKRKTLLRREVLAAVLVGENKASRSFLRMKERMAGELGIDFRVYELAENISTDKLRKEVGRISKLGVVGGVIVQLPLPPKFNRQRVLDAIDLEKDVDVLSSKGIGRFETGKMKIMPPAVGVVREVLEELKVDIREKVVAIVGTGFLVGRPVVRWFLGKAKKVAVFDKGSSLEELKDFDLVVSGAGKAGIIKGEFLKEGAGVIDFGYDEGKGDLDIMSDLNHLSFQTPTPGGTGPVLVAKLFDNYFLLNEVLSKKE